MTLHYDHQKGKDFCECNLMQWDTGFAERMDQVAHAQGVTQEQWDVMVREYAWRVKCLFNPANYTLTQRIGLALHFFNPFAKKDS